MSDKAYQIRKCLAKVEDMLDVINPEKLWFLSYGRIDEQPFEITDWQKQYMHLVGGNSEYIFIQERDFKKRENVLLYVIDVTGDSVITTLEELFRLLGRKF